MTTLILTGLLCLVVGLLLGTIIQKKLPSANQKRNQSHHENKKNNEDLLLRFQQDVSEHFIETAKKLGQVTQQYRELCDHLAESALNLSNPDVSRTITNASNGKLSTENLPLSHYTEDEQASIYAPKDWAPRPPGEKGLLDEDYGLEAKPKEDE